MADDEWITTSDAARLSGYHVERIRELIREGKVIARKFGPVWAVSRESLLSYVRNMEAIGSKRGRNSKTRRS